MPVDVPIKILHEAEGHIVTCETVTGEIYKGKLIKADDHQNCQMTQVTGTYRDGRVLQFENVYIRGSKILFLILPDKKQTKAGIAGREKSRILRGKAARGRGREGAEQRRRGESTRQPGSCSPAGRHSSQILINLRCNVI